MGLQIEPELGFDAEPVAEAQSRIAGDRTLGVDDLAHPIGWHADLTREFRGRDPEFRQLVLQYLAGMDGSLEHLLISPYFSHSPRASLVAMWAGKAGKISIILLSFTSRTTTV